MFLIEETLVIKSFQGEIWPWQVMGRHLRRRLVLAGSQRNLSFIGTRLCKSRNADGLLWRNQRFEITVHPIPLPGKRNESWTV